MNFNLTEEQQMIQAAARDFARERIAPVAADFDQSGEFPLENIRAMGELGLMAIEVPEAYGGAGLDTIGYVLAMIEICAADAAHGTIMSVNNSLFCNGILKHGTEAQKEKYVRAIATGVAEYKSYCRVAHVQCVLCSIPACFNLGLSLLLAVPLPTCACFQHG